MDSKETLKTLQDSGERFEGYSVFDVDFNGTKIKMVTLKDAKEMVTVKNKLYGTGKIMKLADAKTLFEKHHPEEANIIKKREEGLDSIYLAACTL